MASVECPECYGSGTTDSVGSNGFTGSEFSELGSDFASEYFGGRFDQTCETCEGECLVDEDSFESYCDMLAERRAGC
jgi:predicted methyltransferase